MRDCFGDGQNRWQAGNPSELPKWRRRHGVILPRFWDYVEGERKKENAVKGEAI